MNIMLPDYNNSILNLTCSILKHFGVETHHAGLPQIDKLLSGTWKNVVYLTLDGMGSEFLRRVMPRGSFLSSHHAYDLSSVYPCTTTAATTSMLSGLSPIEHGWLGWNCWFKEYGRVVDLFLDRDSFCGFDVKPSPARELMPFKDIAELIGNLAVKDVNCHKVMPPFAENGVNSFKQLAEKIKADCELPGKNLVLAYWYEPDTLMHKDGPYSKSVLKEMISIDQTLSSLFEQLKNTLLIITADHGQVEISEEIFIDDHPEIMDCLILPPSLEVRASSFFVKPAHHSRFKSAFAEIAGENFILLSKEEIRGKGLLGPGEAHHKADDFIGDYLACAVGHTTLRFQSKFDRSRFTFKGHHAGLTREEMIVPLILAK